MWLVEMASSTCPCSEGVEGGGGHVSGGCAGEPKQKPRQHLGFPSTAPPIDDDFLLAAEHVFRSWKKEVSAQSARAC